VKSVEKRIVDLLVPFRTFAYYHPDQKGSASIKVVLPVLTGSGYEDLPIADGDSASIEFMRVTFGDASNAERTKVRKQLEQYCGLDTFGMLKIVLRLERSTFGD
jgi:hypothetical protein